MIQQASIGRPCVGRQGLHAQAFETVYPGKDFVRQLAHRRHRPPPGVRRSGQAAADHQPAAAAPEVLHRLGGLAGLPAGPAIRRPRSICVSYSDDLAKTCHATSSASSRARGTARSSQTCDLDQDRPRARSSPPGRLSVCDVGGRHADRARGRLHHRRRPDQARGRESDKARNGVNDWFRSTLLSRLDDKQRSVLILVMQRLHVNDLTGCAGARWISQAVVPGDCQEG